MKMKMLYLLLLVLTISEMGKAQVTVEISGGIATYQMKDLKMINTLQAGSLPFETLEIDNFDPGAYVNAALLFKLHKDILLGFVYAFNSTGSRIGQKDYSGYYAFDQIINGHFMGIEPAINLAANKYMRLSLCVMAGLNFTRHEMRQALSLQGQTEEDSQLLAALSLNFIPAINLDIPVYTWLSAKISTGYLIDTGGKLHLKGSKDAELTYQNTVAKTGWSGFRIAVGLSYRLN